ncbi:dixin-like isoform X2 [Gigantopelta aegis]|uniref:dixin-like isoform X2 n=1 Tax=Gigantopelta aegis TaxID=1735272 RepID=UPI001B88914F|nr:dixin-like isoform X2 [Gigantopelta aegis]
MSDRGSPIRSVPNSESSTPDETSHAWMEWQQQLKAYVDWLNSQLKKKPGARLVEDLRNDVKDGVALIELIEVVAGEKLAGFHESPSNQSEMKENIERVIQFMATNRIRMHHISAKDIVEGNLKAIMRLILALAAHFKPKSVKHSAHQQIRAERNANISGIAQGASAALADARRHASRAGNRFRRNRDAAVSQRRYQESSSDQFSDSDQPYTSQTTYGGGRNRSRQSRERRELEGASGASPASPAGQRRSPRTALSYTSESSDVVTPPPRSKSTDSMSKDFHNTTVEMGHQEEADLEELTANVKETRTELFRLQELLLCGEQFDGQLSFNEVFEGDTPCEKIVVLRSRLQLMSKVSNDLREDLSRTKNECLQLEGTKAGLQQRLIEQDTQISELKSKLLKRDFERENFLAEKAALVQQFKEKDKLIADLRRDLSKRDEKLDQLHHDMRTQLQEKDQSNQNLKSRIIELHNKLRVVGETGDSLSLRVESQDKKMAKLAGRIFKSPPDENKHSTNKSQSADELQMIRDSLQSLRVHMLTSDPQHHVVDNLEHSIALLLQSKRASAAQTPVNQSQKPRSCSPKRLNFEASSSSTVRKPQSTPAGFGFALNELNNPPTNGQLCTKVLYFTEQAVTPFMGTIHKRLGEITLKDLKSMFDRPGAYKYHFKALDPEYGTVKEELHYDDDVIPGWEGKIVAWIEEIHGTPC